MHTVCVLDPFSALQVPLPWGQALNQPLPEGREFWGPQGPALPAPCDGLSPLHPTPSAPPRPNWHRPPRAGGNGEFTPPRTPPSSRPQLSVISIPRQHKVSPQTFLNKRKKKICRWMSKRKPRQRPFHGGGLEEDGRERGSGRAGLEPGLQEFWSRTWRCQVQPP